MLVGDGCEMSALLPRVGDDDGWGCPAIGYTPSVISVARWLGIEMVFVPSEGWGVARVHLK